MNANLIIFLREVRIFTRAFLLNFLLILLLALIGIKNPLPSLTLVSAIYFCRVEGCTINSILSSLLFVLIVFPFSWQEHFANVAVGFILIVLLLKRYRLRECAWASWTLGLKLLFCLYLDGFDFLMVVAFLWFMLSGNKEMNINTEEKPPFDILPKR